MHSKVLNYFYKIMAGFVLLISCQDSLQIKFDESQFMASINGYNMSGLKTKKILFGHMSVGYNILDGLSEILDDDSNIRITELADGDTNTDSAGFYHKRNGKNGDPHSKCDAFKDFLTADDMGNKLDVAFFKFCYVDIKRETDVQNVFDYYVGTIDSIKIKFPHLQIIHVTIPLMVHNYTFKQIIKNFIKSDLANIKRNRFNQLLIKKYGNIDLIFDLAKAESTFPDGSREYFTSDSETYYSLIKQYSTDGGHLNGVGRKWVARELLNVLNRNE